MSTTGKRGESELPLQLDAEALKRAIFDAGPDAVLCVNSQGSIVLANSRAEELFGYQAGELLGLSIEELVPERFRPRHLEHRYAFHQEPRPRAMGAGMIVAGKRRDGSEFPATINLSPQSTPDGPFVAAVVADITEVRRTQEQLRDVEERNRRIIELSPDAYITLAEDGQILSTNRAGVELVGATASTDVIGRSIYEFLPEDGRQKVEDKLSSLLCRETMLPFTDQPLLRLDGSTVQAEIAALSTPDSQGIALVLVARDLTEVKRAEELWVRALAAEESERLKTSLLSVVSHELRTPLTAVRGYASTMVEYMDLLEVDEMREYARGIDSAAQHLERLVTDLLTLSRIESNALQLDLTDVHIGTFLRVALDSHMVSSPQQAFTISVLHEDPLVRLDTVRMRQVIDNLLSNALKYAEGAGPIRVNVGVRQGFVQVSVRDFGPGVPRESLREIFEPFMRYKRGASHSVSGTGLGLAVCKGIIAAHGGQIWAEIPRGGGFQVTFRIPLTNPAVQSTSYYGPAY